MVLVEIVGNNHKWKDINVSSEYDNEDIDDIEMDECDSLLVQIDPIGINNSDNDNDYQEYEEMPYGDQMSEDSNNLEVVEQAHNNDVHNDEDNKKDDEFTIMLKSILYGDASVNKKGKGGV